MDAKEINTRKSMAYTAYLMEKNFTGDDLFITFGYMPGHGPRNQDAARFHLKSAVIDPVRRLRKSQGVPCLYAYSTRWKETDTPAEHSLVLSAGQETPEMLASLWQYGPVVCRPLREMGALSGLVRRLYEGAGEDAPRYHKPIVHSVNLR